MNPTRMVAATVWTALLAGLALPSCGEESVPPARAPAAGGAANDDVHGAEGVVPMGEQTIAGHKVKAARDGAGPLGADAPVDIWVDGGTGGMASCRFWIGTEDAKGSVKAKADVEVDHWHTHAEVPQPLPTGSKLWVELETATGEKHRLSFELRN
ncbi:MAG: hypothetical protein JNL90_11480 [Planctomycetes bacterium]|nr:hypothetical protein [Planctomycetota bacterium]